jgi:hypothetical protein
MKQIKPYHIWTASLAVLLDSFTCAVLPLKLSKGENMFATLKQLPGFSYPEGKSRVFKLLHH